MSFSLTLELKRVQNAVQVQGDAIVYPANHTACFSVTDCLLPAQQFYGPGTVLCDVLQVILLTQTVCFLLIQVPNSIDYQLIEEK